MAAFEVDKVTLKLKFINDAGEYTCPEFNATATDEQILTTGEALARLFPEITELYTKTLREVIKA